MTNKQIENLTRYNSFIKNIGKLSVGRKTRLRSIDQDGTERVLATVRCDTRNEYPRKFTVMSSSGYMQTGSGYTYQRVVKNAISGLTDMLA